MRGNCLTKPHPLHSPSVTKLTQQAIDILTNNDRGGFTIPTPKLYPFQWNWDSAFAALGFATFDHDRAWTEIETLLEGQWADGMLPHIVFKQPDKGYFPGPDVWGTNKHPPSSGHSQPPVVTSIVCELARLTKDHSRAAKLFPKLMRYHEWFHTMRDPDTTGLVAAIHPWETGRDNCPDWDIGMNNIAVPDDLPAYIRRDTSEVNADQRPDTLQYDRFLSIVKFAREQSWDHQIIYRDGPFLMADPGIQFILLRADRDLLQLANDLGYSEQTSKIQCWIDQSMIGCNLLWNSAINAYTAKDLRTDSYSHAVTSASMLSFYANAGDESQRRHMLNHANCILESVQYGFPSWDPRDTLFEARRYWRGPVWAIVNLMISRGLRESGETKMADRIKNDTIALIEATGFNEYFNPDNGEALGGQNFTWTAAVYLAMTNELVD